MADRTSKFILARDIRLDKGYKNILNYTETQMLTLVTNKAVATGSNLSFIREQNALDIEVAYGTALQANYLAFQNPDYSNKWFFAFIDDIEYISNASTRIHFTVDECSTWYDYWTAEPCFVEREHVNLDTVGLNTVPEDLEHGEYVVNTQTTDDNLDDIAYIVQATEPYDADSNATRAWFVGGIANAGVAYYAKYAVGITVADNPLMAVIDEFASAGKLDKITNVYVIPQKLLGLTSQSPSWSRIWGNFVPTTYDLSIAKTVTIQGYTPKNNKLLTKEYNCLVVDNNNGSANTYGYEDFIGTSCVFEVAGVPSCGGSVKIVPKNYKGAGRFEQEGLVGGKYPTCGWINDQYTNWLTQQSVNLQNGIISTVAGVAIGGAMMATGVGAGAGGYLIGTSIGTGIAGIAGNMVQKFQHHVMPATAEGNINAGDVITSARRNKFHFLHMTIKAEYAAQIDGYFTRFGYKVNLLKIPNQTGRTYWNYVKIGSGEDIGSSTNQTISVPPKSMEVINQAYRNGVTIWHDHANVGNFALNNTIVS